SPPLCLIDHYKPPSCHHLVLVQSRWACSLRRLGQDTFQGARRISATRDWRSRLVSQPLETGTWAVGVGWMANSTYLSLIQLVGAAASRVNKMPEATKQRGEYITPLPNPPSLLRPTRAPPTSPNPGLTNPSVEYFPRLSTSVASFLTRYWDLRPSSSLTTLVLVSFPANSGSQLQRTPYRSRTWYLAN
ncbi:hypothetical protein CORC01_05688, partial [Colletotrichum orchidophilum]